MKKIKRLTGDDINFKMLAYIEEKGFEFDCDDSLNVIKDEALMFVLTNAQDWKLPEFEIEGNVIFLNGRQHLSCGELQMEVTGDIVDKSHFTDIEKNGKAFVESCVGFLDGELTWFKVYFK